MSLTIIDTFEKLIDFQEKIDKHKNKWVFRGEQYNGDIKNSLRTSLEMAFDSIDPSIKKTALNKHKRNAEKDIIREFQRKLHLYSGNLPTRADILQWLSLMQHHGAPTRLLDWTYSFWVAVHFAVSRSRPGKEVAIWAVNAEEIANICRKFQKKPQVKRLSREMAKKHYLLYCDPDAIRDNAILHQLIISPIPMVYISSSFRRNERLTLQQGTFLVTGDVRKSFKENLSAVVKSKRHIKVGIIKVTANLKYRIIKELGKMNINNAVLFPGLDGFSQSLWTRVSLCMEDKLLLKDKELVLYP